MMPTKRSMLAAKRFLKEMADEGFNLDEAMSVGEWLYNITKMRSRTLLETEIKSVLEDDDYALHESDDEGADTQITD